MTQKRGVSVTLDYVMLLAVATVMLVAMVTAVGGVVDSQLNHAVQDELTVTGQSLATELEQADRLYQSTEDNASTLTIEKYLPSHVSGTAYRITVDGSAKTVTLSTTRPETTITVSFNATSIAAEEQSFRGGPVTISLVDGALEVDAA